MHARRAELSARSTGSSPSAASATLRILTAVYTRYSGTPNMTMTMTISFVFVILYMIVRHSANAGAAPEQRKRRRTGAASVASASPSPAGSVWLRSAEDMKLAMMASCMATAASFSQVIDINRYISELSRFPPWGDNHDCENHVTEPRHRFPDQEFQPPTA